MVHLIRSFAYPEFFNATFRKTISYFNVAFDATPVSGHNKSGCFERKHAAVNALSHCIKLDAKFTFSEQAGSTSDSTLVTTAGKILSGATYLSIALYGIKILSSFQMAKEYTLSVLGLPKSLICNSIFMAHQEQEAKRKLRKLKKTRNPKVLSSFQIWSFHKPSHILLSQKQQVRNMAQGISLPGRRSFRIPFLEFSISKAGCSRGIRGCWASSPVNIVAIAEQYWCQFSKISHDSV